MPRPTDEQLNLAVVMTDTLGRTDEEKMRRSERAKVG